MRTLPIIITNAGSETQSRIIQAFHFPKSDRDIFSKFINSFYYILYYIMLTRCVCVHFSTNYFLWVDCSHARSRHARSRSSTFFVFEKQFSPIFSGGKFAWNFSTGRRPFTINYMPEGEWGAIFHGSPDCLVNLLDKVDLSP